MINHKLSMGIIKSIINTYRTTSHSILRIIMGIPPIISFIYYHKLIWYYKFFKESTEDYDLSWISMKNDYIYTNNNIAKCIKIRHSFRKSEYFKDNNSEIKDIDHAIKLFKKTNNIIDNEKFFQINTFSAQIL